MNNKIIASFIYNIFYIIFKKYEYFYKSYKIFKNILLFTNYQFKIKFNKNK